jgi:hypothetical protein
MRLFICSALDIHEIGFYRYHYPYNYLLERTVRLSAISEHFRLFYFIFIWALAKIAKKEHIRAPNQGCLSAGRSPISSARAKRMSMYRPTEPGSSMGRRISN